MQPGLPWLPMLVFHLVFTETVSEIRAQDVARPVGTVSVGDSPFALAISSDSREAVVVNLFPETSDATNVKLVDLNSQSVKSRLRVGTRLVAVAITGTRALVVNEDQDFVIVVDLNSATEITRIRVGSRPSNVTIANGDTAVATNGTSPKISALGVNRLAPPPFAVTIRGFRPSAQRHDEKRGPCCFPMPDFVSSGRFEMHDRPLVRDRWQ